MSQHKCPNGHTDIRAVSVSSISIDSVKLTFNNQTLVDAAGRQSQTIYYRCNVCGARFNAVVDGPLPTNGGVDGAQ